MRWWRILMGMAAAMLLTANVAFAQVAAPRPLSGPVDPRIRTITYDPGAVITLRGYLGYQMMITFDPDERIENVSIGDSLAWQVTPNRRATLLFLKPIEANASTNMTVVTTLRRYTFQLRAGEASGPNDPSIVYELRFAYLDKPPPAAPKAAPKEETIPASELNFSYTVKGSKGMTPTRVFDDGRFTYFEFPPGLDSPAVFVIGPTGQEELVNNQVRGRYNVIDVVAKQFVLRYGKGKTNVTNDGYRTPGFASEAPSVPK
jgi:type IV secretion system protein VirB9